MSKEYQEKVLDVIKNSRPILEKYRGIRRILENILEAVDRLTGIKSIMEKLTEKKITF
ncbi:hypothetical protein RVIR1_07660 [Candidatus Rickettsiella viridis]|uniref:Uncharacterized protein n=1 Tax=Candidatus Rickettsiella viridis TaxID=676208 RepID=A0A2Z5UW11_9COXI|nr:hypothetical protein [Candidatus Rickettsiella viridis]BBB15255.1 hypothetical protein RVIR1_07660 [Candidatus Rickettsiella viridis]